MSHAIKYFGLNNIALEHDLRKVARDKKLQIRPSKTKSNLDAYYPQITERIRHDAAAMAEHYELFYCLEISIRDLIRSTLEEKESDWWINSCRNACATMPIRANREKVRLG
jgi:lipopolysaccharide biosynthesis protein